jgi:predicted metal-dependent enzyme (double-stranded beta helix superfamily)
MKKWVIALGLFGLVAFAWRHSAAVPEELDPVKVAPETHKVIFENQFVRVLDVHLPPGIVEPWHKHSRRVVVDLVDFQTRSTDRGGQPKDSVRKAGGVRWSEEVVHTVTNTGKTEGRAISIELK